MARNTSVVLSDHFNDFITRAVESGRYASASDVVRAGLRMLEMEEEKLERLRAELQKGLDSGFIEDFDFDEFLAEMHAKHRA
jgi:antitoxin ParD1/3/4